MRKPPEYKTATVSARWLADVLPPEIAEAQELWERLHLARRLRLAKVPLDERRNRLGIIPAFSPLQAINIDDVSPLENYLSQAESLTKEFQSHQLAEKIKVVLNDKALCEAAIARARKSMAAAKLFNQQRKKSHGRKKN